MRKITLSLLILLVLPALAGAQSFVRWIPPPNVISLYETSTNVVLTKPFSLPDGSATAPSLGNGTSGFRFDSGGIYAIRSGAEAFYMTRSGTTSSIRLCVSGAAGCATFSYIAATPTAFSITAAGNVTELVSGTAAQTFNIYNTFTDAGNYERAELKWDSNMFKISVGKAGSGTARSLQLLTGSATSGALGEGNNAHYYWNSARFYSGADDTYELGQSGAQAWTHLALKRSIQGSKSKTLTDNVATTFVRIAIPQTIGSNFTGGTLIHTIHCDDGTATNTATSSGEIVFTCVNNAGSESCSFGTYAVNEYAKINTGAYSISTTTFTGTNPGTDTIDLTVQSDCGGVSGPTNMYIHYRLDLTDPQTVTPL